MALLAKTEYGGKAPAGSTVNEAFSKLRLMKPCARMEELAHKRVKQTVNNLAVFIILLGYERITDGLKERCFARCPRANGKIFPGLPERKINCSIILITAPRLFGMANVTHWSTRIICSTSVCSKIFGKVALTITHSNSAKRVPGYHNPPTTISADRKSTRLN